MRVDRWAALVTLDLGRRERDEGLPEGAPRVCVTRGCDTFLSRFNTRQVCSACEMGDRQFVPAPQPSFPSRVLVIDASRPTTEGAVPLPGVVRARERSYAEMIAITKPPAPEPVVLEACACDVCGGAFTPSRVTQLRCSDECVRRHRTQYEAERRTGAAAPRPARGAGRPGRRGGSERTFDWAEAAEVFRECGNYAETARRIGQSSTATTFAVKHELGEELAAALLKRPVKDVDVDELVRRFRETRNYSLVASEAGVSHRTVTKHIRRALGFEEAARVEASRVRSRIDPSVCKRRGCTVKPRPHGGKATSQFARLCEEHYQEALQVQRDRRERLHGGRRLARGPARKFDHDEATRLWLECRSYATVARRLGTSSKSARMAVIRELARRGEPVPVVGRVQLEDETLCRRTGCTEPARPESIRKTSRWRRLCEAHHCEVVEEQSEKRKATHARLSAPQPSAAELHATIDRLEVELDEVAELIRQADEVAA